MPKTILLLACLVAALTWSTGAAAEEMFSATIHGVSSQSAAPMDQGRGRAITIRMRGEAVRIDTVEADRSGVYLLSAPDGRHRWLVNKAEGVAAPVAGSAFRFRVDPAAPCSQMRARCRRVGGDVVAGRIAQRWRYRDAAGNGPDNTDQGELLVDPTTGLVLAYRGGRDDGVTEIREFRAVSVSLDPVPQELFRLPDEP